MFHLAAFTTPAAAITNGDVPALNDGLLTIQNGHFILQQDMKLLAAIAGNSTLSNARIDTPHFRQVGTPSIIPNTTSIQGFGSLGNTMLYEPPYLTVQRYDELALQATTTGVGASNIYGLVYLGDGNVNVPQGDIYTLRATATITAVASQWTRGTFSFESTLPAGRYSVVGMAALGATMLAARLRFQGYQWLPGTGASASQVSLSERAFRFGRSGEFGQFDNTAIPNIEILCNAADTAQTIFLDLIRVR